ncbi:MAG: hypothetical protein Q8K60_05120, partial [Parachlamydiaceae bacterium]|nr:hypothetical protein [Parachlamydiaceae bacterium]
MIESDLKLENNEDAIINSNDIAYEGNVVENTNGSIIGTNNINFDLHETFVNNSTRINAEKIEVLKKNLLETKQLDVFDGIYSQGTLTIKDGCKTYDNSALLYVSALDVDGGDRFDNSGFVTVLQRLDLKNFKNVMNQTNAIIQAVDINIYTQEFTNNGFYTAITSIINAPIKLDHKNGRFAIAESATFDFGDSKIDALFASEGKVVLKGGSLELNQNVQVKELEITTTKKLTLTDKALIKAETILLNGKEIENNGQIGDKELIATTISLNAQNIHNNGLIHGKIIDLKADELKHLKGTISAKADLNFEVLHATSKSSMMAEKIYINKKIIEGATFDNYSTLNARSALYLGHLSSFVNVQNAEVVAPLCTLYEGANFGKFTNNGKLDGQDLNLSLNTFEHSGFAENYKTIKLTNAQTVTINKNLIAKEYIDCQGVTAKIAEDLNAPIVTLNFATKLDILDTSTINAGQKIELISPIIEQVGSLESSTIIIKANEFNNSNFIEAQNLLEITAKNTLHNHLKGYLKSKDVIEIKTTLLNNKHVIQARGKLSIDENNNVINSGKLISQGEVNGHNISPIDKVSPKIYLTIHTQKLDNTGRIFAGSLDIDTCKNGQIDNQVEHDFSNTIGQISALHDLTLKGALFYNATLLDAPTQIITYQKILNDEKGIFTASDSTIKAEYLDNKNIIDVQNILSLTVQNEFHNHEKSYLKSNGDIKIKAKLIDNRNVIQAGDALTIDENNELINTGTLLSQWNIKDDKPFPNKYIAPQVFLTIDTHKLENRGHIYGGSLNIDTRKGIDELNPQYDDFSNALGEIKALQHLVLSGAKFHNKTMFYAETIKLNFQSMTNDVDGWLEARDSIVIKAKNVDNKNVIQAGGKLSIKENDQCTNTGWLLSQWVVKEQVISEIKDVLPAIYLKIVTQNLDNKGHIFGGSLDITTSKNGYNENQKQADCLNELGKIKALYDLTLKGSTFNNKTVLAAETMNFTFQKITNEGAGWLDASKSIEIKAKNVDNKNVIQAGGTLSIEENDQLTNTGWLISQGSLDENSNILPVKDVLPKVYLTINTQQLDNRGHVFGSSLDITTSRNGYDKDQKVADCSNGLGQIKALQHLILKGAMFNNAALLDAETMTLTYQKILNEEKGVIAAKDITIDADLLDNKNRIEAQNLLDITAKKEAHNHENSYLKAEG